MLVRSIAFIVFFFFLLPCSIPCSTEKNPFPEPTGRSRCAASWIDSEEKSKMDGIRGEGERERETKIKPTSPSLRTSSSHSCRRSSWTKFSSLPPFSFSSFCAFLHYLFLPSSFFVQNGLPCRADRN
ncbi:uncharacterized protein BO88DRAFT_15480 [Aspergillus vadensis CBS 113365]|uniref:Secreted protein n=1 Tax=Aspergillus vadensis (strain CBS 113365 / IMI 142717 / IBT 24658) TaxID=1448311 RepID=A0A319BPQ3_ASPVC|nr:hypothetical protein BO88DRAFT_15480 [Aspergillus vadensis CBS 113365]PYH74527.1 hypothetical protein BO88DRAFT_15480 [Aspergillus vadensis CBS 113365]